MNVLPMAGAPRTWPAVTRKRGPPKAGHECTRDHQKAGRQQGDDGAKADAHGVGRGSWDLHPEVREMAPRLGPPKKKRPARC